MSIKTAQISWKIMSVLLLSMLCLLALNATALAQDTEQPKIEIIKTPSSNAVSPGDIVTYTYVIANTGNVTLTDIVAVDDVLGTIPLNITTLVPTSVGSGTVTLPDGSTVTYPAIITGTLTMVVGDDMSVELINTVVVTGTTESGDDTTDSDTVQIGYVGTIGNRIWSVVDNGVIEPRADVVVNLYDEDGNLVATTMTDADGYYLFTNLPLGVYVVEVDTSTLPLDKQELPPSISSDNGNDSKTTVVLSDSRPYSLIEDFAYAGPTAVSLSNVAVSTAVMPLLISALIAVTAGTALVAQRKS